MRGACGASCAAAEHEKRAAPKAAALCMISEGALRRLPIFSHEEIPDLQNVFRRDSELGRKEMRIAASSTPAAFESAPGT